MDLDRVDSNRSAAPKNNGPRIVKLAIFGQTYSSILLMDVPFSSTYLSGVMFSTSSTWLILRTKDTIASSSPIGTATVKLTNTVNKKVVTSTSESDVFNFNISANVLYSLILKATTIKIGAILASGT